MSDLSKNMELLCDDPELFLKDLEMLSLGSFKLSDQMIMCPVKRLKGYWHTRMITTSALSTLEMTLHDDAKR